MKHQRLSLLLILSTLSAALSAEPVDSLLHLFYTQHGAKRTATANTLMQTLVGVGFGDEITFDADTPPDTVAMTVGYYAAEYMLAQQQYAATIDAARRVLPLTEHHPDYTWRSETLNLLTRATFQQSDYIQALRFAEADLAVSQEHHDHGRMASTLNTMAGIYLGIRQPEQAVQYIERAMQADAKDPTHEHAPAIYAIASEVYQGLEDYEQALNYARRSLQLEESLGHADKVAVRQSQMASICVSMADTLQAHALLRQCIPVLQQCGALTSLGISLNTLGEVMRLEGRLDDAARHFGTANQIFEHTGDRYNRSRSLHGLFAALYDSDPKAAMLYLDHYNKLKDTLYQADMKQLLTNYTAKFRNDELAEENAVVRKANQWIIGGGILVVLLLLGALAALIGAFRLKSKRNRQLLELQQTRNYFFANITHEFRTPLTAILGIGQRLSSLPEPTAGKPDAVNIGQIHSDGDILQRQGSRLLQLINELLDLSKLRSKAEPEGWRTDNIVPYLNMVMETFYTYAHDQGVQLQFAPRENEVTMDFIPDYIHKIVSNIVSNAIKFAADDGHVNMITRLDGEQYVIQVADDGVGISRQEQKHIFEPFFRGSHPATHAVSGTGVGLALTHQLITNLGGTIRVDSSTGKGTVVTVKLPTHYKGGGGTPLTDDELRGIVPLTVLDEIGENLPESPDSDSTDETRVLIVEDNHDLAQYLGQLLKPYYQVYYASDGRRGLERAEQLVPDLIITDVMMPEMDGFELCQQVRASQLTSHVPIIVITARTEQEALMRGIELGADAFLHKPFNADELLVRVRKLLEQREFLRQKFSAVADSTDKNADNGMTPQDIKLMGRITDLVCSLMGRSEADVNNIADRLNMTTSQLRRKVQALTGKTPSNYFMQIRLSNAQRIIDAHPDMPISEVADQCGFFDQAHFSHVFKEAFGISPTQWAKRAKGE